MAKLSDELRSCLPESGPIREYVEWAAPLSHAPPTMHLASIVPLAGYELCRRGLTLGRLGPPRVWFGIVASSSVGKTSTLGEARKFSEAFYAERFSRENSAPKPWVSLEGSLPGVIHAIAQLTDERGRTAGILYHNEFSKVVRLDDVVEPLNEIYDGRDYSRNLRYLQKATENGQQNGMQAQIKSPAFSAVVTTTPRAFERVIKPEILEGGLFVRFLWLHERLLASDLQPQQLDDPAGWAQVLHSWDNWFGTLEAMRLHNLLPTIRIAEDANGWMDHVFFEVMRERIAREDVESGLALRAPAQTRHLAAIYAASRGSFACDVGDSRPFVYVTLSDVMSAANLVMRCLGKGAALGVQLGLESMRLSEKHTRVLAAVQEAGLLGLTRGEVFRLFSSNLDKNQIDSLIATLVDASEIHEEVVMTPGQRGRPPKVIYSTQAWRILEAQRAKTNSN